MWRPPFLLLLVSLYSSCATDLTLDARTKGEDVVDAVLKNIKRANMKEFLDDQGFLKRLACVESSYGNDVNTYTARAGKAYYGGVWQMDEDTFKQTVDSDNLLHLYKRIEDKIGISWFDVRWSDLWKPMYSGLAVRILFKVKLKDNEKFPGTVKEQAKFWKEKYRPSGDEQAFIDRVAQCEAKTCKGRMDLSIVLDKSGSVSQEPFDEAKVFVNRLINTFTGTNDLEESAVRFAFQTYDHQVTKIFPLDNQLTAAARSAAVTNAEYTAGNTFTGDAILASVGLFRTATGTRPGVPKVMTVFTDGNSNGGAPIQPAAATAKADGITVFAIGIGAGIRQSELELIAQDEPDRTFALDGFDGLAEFFHRMNSETCKIPQTPQANATTVDRLEKDEKRYFTFKVEDIGLMVTMDYTTGQTAGYYSYTEDTPSAAIHDGVLSKGRTHIPYKNMTAAALAFSVDLSTVYVSVTGLKATNEYSLHAAASHPDPTQPPRTRRPEPPVTPAPSTSTAPPDPNRGQSSTPSQLESTPTPSAGSQVTVSLFCLFAVMGASFVRL